MSEKAEEALRAMLPLCANCAQWQNQLKRVVDPMACLGKGYNVRCRANPEYDDANHPGNVVPFA